RGSPAQVDRRRTGLIADRHSKNSIFYPKQPSPDMADGCFLIFFLLRSGCLSGGMRPAQKNMQENLCKPLDKLH
ncbi:MAG: hypothetical protein SPG37_08880, partial [Eubacteriales bacterium]|nr:hypothetical protein [Eubacteriales bacterium]